MDNKNYENEARSRWGNTDAYREHEEKTKNYTKEKWFETNEGLMAIWVRVRGRILLHNPHSLTLFQRVGASVGYQTIRGIV